MARPDRPHTRLRVHPGRPPLPEGWECYFCSALNALFTVKCFGCGAPRTNGA